MTNLSLAIFYVYKKKEIPNTKRESGSILIPKRNRQRISHTNVDTFSKLFLMKKYEFSLQFRLGFILFPCVQVDVFEYVCGFMFILDFIL